ncbi:MAG: DNA polymerase III subunit gamma/tau [Candidatus Desulforudis sp.]|nr:DNA polymerase III subunit gamma/tau [Desulforudis sp.]
MPYQTLYRTWRPQRFAEVVGQAHVVRTLANAVSAGRVAHAYLFCGPRGTGKTTTAKVLAKAVNCTRRQGAEPCGECPSCVSITAGTSMDVLEIDAASNRGVDEVRELREKVKFRPAAGDFKVYIVDEVHMLTNEAFNALLKTLEEPPGHVIFVLATTEPHKLPLTITSRCQRFDFRRITRKDLVMRLEEVAEQSGLTAESGVFALIARVADGSLRDALGILDQAAALGEDRISLADLHSILGTVTDDVLERLVRRLLSGETGPALVLLQEVEAAGKELRIFARELTDYLRGLLHAAYGAGQAAVGPPESDRERLIDLLALFARAEQEMRFATRQILPLELAVVGSARRRGAAAEAGAGASSRADGTPDLEQVWGEVLAEFRRRNPPVGPWLARSEPILAGPRKLQLKFRDELAKEKVALPENKGILEKVLNRFYPGRWQITCVLDGDYGEP